MLRMQLPRETDRSSLGEKLSPLPWLSFGASVVRTVVLKEVPVVSADVPVRVPEARQECFAASVEDGGAGWFRNGVGRADGSNFAVEDQDGVVGKILAADGVEEQDVIDEGGW